MRQKSTRGEWAFISSLAIVASMPRDNLSGVRGRGSRRRTNSPCAPTSTMMHEFIRSSNDVYLPCRVSTCPVPWCCDDLSELVRSLTPQNSHPHGGTRLGGRMRPQPHNVLSMTPMPLLHSFIRHLALYEDEREPFIVSSSCRKAVNQFRPSDWLRAVSVGNHRLWLVRLPFGFVRRAGLWHPILQSVENRLPFLHSRIISWTLPWNALI
jgi:hypothetical protein